MVQEQQILRTLLSGTLEKPEMYRILQLRSEQNIFLHNTNSNDLDIQKKMSETTVNHTAQNKHGDNKWVNFQNTH